MNIYQSRCVWCGTFIPLGQQVITEAGGGTSIWYWHPRCHELYEKKQNRKKLAIKLLRAIAIICAVIAIALYVSF